MKIIAATNEGYLIEANVTEVAQLKGFRNAGDMERNRFKLAVGVTIEPIKFVRGMSKEHLGSIVNELEGAIRQVNEAQKVAEGMNIFETIKEVSND